MRLFFIIALLINVSFTHAQDTNQTTVADTVRLLMKTNRGDIVLELDRAKAPISVENFLTYVEGEHYNGTIFHRVIRNFMIQGGGYTPVMTKKATLPPIKNEANNGLNNRRGTIAMARTNAVDSATSQFFINVKDNGFLDHGARGFGYAVFGKVIEGMDVVDAISTVATTRTDEPLETVEIISVTPL